VDEEFEWADVTLPPTGRRFLKIDTVVVGLNLARGIAASFAQSLELAQSLVAMHANYQVERHALAEQAAIEIETMTRGEGNG
jgi:hypothetical protein